MVRIVVFALGHGDFVDAARRLFAEAAADDDDGQEAVEVRETDVRTLPVEPGVAFVSPANSLCFMDGGIEYVYSRVMFPGLEPFVKAAVAARGRVTKLGRPFLNIGEAMVVPVPPAPGVAAAGVRMVVAPTMFMPQDVRGTENAYAAMYATLRAALDFNARQHQQGQGPPIRTLYVPGMCTGFGRMPGVEAAEQMRDAYVDVMSGQPPRITQAALMAQQPRVYENTEFLDIDPAEVVSVVRH